MTADLPLLSGQASIWAAEQFGTAGVPYNFRWAVSYSADIVSADRLASIAAELVDRHPACRARIVDDGGVPSQRFDAPATVGRVTAPTADLEGRAAVAELHETSGCEPFDLAGTLSRLHVVESRERVHLVSCQHHVMFDGLARAHLIEEIGAAVEGASLGAVDDYAAVVAESIELERDAAGRAGAVIEQLGDVSAADDLPSARHDWVFTAHPEPGLGVRLRDRKGLAGAFLSAVIATAPPPRRWPLVGMVVSTRPRPDVGVVGCFVNTVPVLLGDEPATVERAAAALRDAARDRHLGASELSVAARRAGVPLDLDKRPLVSLAAVASASEATVLDAPGHRPGPLTARLWMVNSDAVFSVEHLTSVVRVDDAQAWVGRQAAALRDWAEET